jgi:hypothetical protein
MYKPTPVPEDMNLLLAQFSLYGKGKLSLHRRGQALRAPGLLLKVTVKYTRKERVVITYRPYIGELSSTLQLLV